jgi:hypothetical protein
MTSLAEEKKHQELGVCSQCLLCDDFFMMVVDTIPPPAFFKGKVGAAALEDLLEALQKLHCALEPTLPDKPVRQGNHDQNDMLDAYIDMLPGEPQKKEAVPSKKTVKAAKQGIPSLLGGWFSTFAASNGICNGCHFLPCPTCAELSNGMAFSDYVCMRGDDHPTVLTPCRFYIWAQEEGEEEELAPLYVNVQQDRTAKPKWTLAQGLGPPNLELDKSRSYRLFKGSLRQFGIKHHNYHKRVEKEELSIKPAMYQRMVKVASYTIASTALAALEKAQKKSGQDPDDPFARMMPVPTPKPTALVAKLWSLAPLFLNWGKVDGQMATPPAEEGGEETGDMSMAVRPPDAPHGSKKGGAMAGSKKDKRNQTQAEEGKGKGGRGGKGGSGKGGKGKRR